MISKSHKFILITPQKTASTSLVTSLKEYIEFADIIPQFKGRTFDYSEIKGQNKPDKHKKAQGYSPEILSGEYKTFCSIRNPFDRMFSWWRFYGLREYPNTSFRDFILNPNIRKLNPIMPDYVSINGRVSIENFIRFEHLQDDFDTMCDIVKIPRHKLSHINIDRDNLKHYTEYYDDDTIDVVSKMFKSDLEFFNYEFKENG